MANSENIILVPLDFSDYSQKASALAFDIAAKYNASILFLHANFAPVLNLSYSEPEPDTTSYEEMDEDLTMNIEKTIENQVEQFDNDLKEKIKNKEFADIKYEFEILDGVPEEIILKVSKEVEPYAIVMGTRGKSKKELDIIGSVTAEIIDSSDYPVFAIPEDSDLDTLDKIKKIAYITNFDAKDFLSFDKMLSLDDFKNKNIYMIIVSDNTSESDKDQKLTQAKKYMSEKYNDLQLDFEIIPFNNFLNDTDTMMAGYNIDLLVLPTHKRNIFARLFNPSIARKMVFHTNTAVLSIRGKS